MGSNGTELDSMGFDWHPMGLNWLALALNGIELAANWPEWAQSEDVRGNEVVRVEQDADGKLTLLHSPSYSMLHRKRT